VAELDCGLRLLFAAFHSDGNYCVFHAVLSSTNQSENHSNKRLIHVRVDFSSSAAFKQTIEQIDFSQFLFGYDN